MARKNISLALSMLVVIASGVTYVQASDPELTKDFFVPEGTNVSTLDSSFFKFTGFEKGVSLPKGVKFGVNKAFSAAFPALTGLGVASAQLNFLPGGLNPPHTHPRGTEILYVCAGSLEVGLIDTTNKLYTQTLQTGDLFVFPEGLVHYQINTDPKVPTKAISSFSSSNPGLVSLPSTLFGSWIDASILAKAFAVTEDIIGTLEAPFQTSHTQN